MWPRVMAAVSAILKHWEAGQDQADDYGHRRGQRAA